MSQGYYNQNEVLSITKLTKLSLLNKIIDGTFPEPTKLHYESNGVAVKKNGVLVEENIWKQTFIDNWVKKQRDTLRKYRPSREYKYMTDDHLGYQIRWIDIEDEFKPIIYWVNQIEGWTALYSGISKSPSDDIIMNNKQYGFHVSFSVSGVKGFRTLRYLIHIIQNIGSQAFEINIDSHIKQNHDLEIYNSEIEFMINIKYGLSGVIKPSELELCLKELYLSVNNIKSEIILPSKVIH